MTVNLLNFGKKSIKKVKNDSKFIKFKKNPGDLKTLP